MPENTPQKNNEKNRPQQGGVEKKDRWQKDPNRQGYQKPDERRDDAGEGQGPGPGKMGSGEHKDDRRF
ncbi:MAG TPA: hypothetical protein VKE22_18630 [Haliangiales bacterium]|nr:hypothetical protein [Haliangiales bacterium]